MSELLLSDNQMRRIEPYFPLSHGIPRVDDRRILSGILFVIRNGLRWRDAPSSYGPHKTLYNRFVRWSRLDVFNRIFAELAGEGDGTLMIDALRSKRIELRPAFSKRGFTPMYRAQSWRTDQQAACRLRWKGTTAAAPPD